MAKKGTSKAPQFIVQERLADRSELTTKYGDNALPLLGLSLYVQAEDINALAAETLTDGGNDKKIDFCFIDRTTNYAAIVQGFCSKTWGKASAEGNKASDLIAAAGWLFTGDLQKVPEKLRDVAAELRDAIAHKEINRIEFLYIHNCRASQNVSDELDTAVSTAAQLIDDDTIQISAHEIGIEKLDDLCRAAEEEIFVDETVLIPGSNVIREKGQVWDAVVASMPGDWLHALHQKYGAQLFKANFRDFLGIRKSLRNINNGIKTSVQKDSNNFWTYNNGITALTRKISTTKNGTKIEGLAIINGAQTTGSIAECSPAEAANLKVVCRFVTCSESGVLHNIIKYNNTQNAFRSSDQRSNDTLQRRLQTDLQKLGVSYLPRRSGITIPSGAITAEAVAPLLCSFHGDPQTAARRRNDIFDLEAIYTKVFPSSCKAEHIILVNTIGAAIDEVKLEHKATASGGTPTRQQIKNYEVLKHSTSKLYVLAIIGAISEEIVGKALPDSYTWRFSAVSLKKKEQLRLACAKEVVEAVLPLLAGIIGNNAYAETRDFNRITGIADQISSLISAGGDAVSNRFALMRDETEW